MIGIYTSSKPHRTNNDDIAGYQGSTLWLMDGATQLVPPDHGRDASWHVNALDKAFRAALSAAPDIDLLELARNAVKEVADDFYRASGLTRDAAQELRPFSTLVLSRISPRKDYLDYLVVCDSTLAVIGPDRETIITDGRIDETNPLAGLYDQLRSGNDFQSEPFRQEMQNLYLDTAKRINAPGGFDVIGQDEIVIDRALTGRIALGPDDHVLLMSDGFTRAVDTLDIYKSWDALKQTLEYHGGDTVIEEIRAAERADLHGQKYLRSSVHDDATLLWMQPS